MIRVNGTPTEVREGVTIADLLEELGIDPAARGVAVAVDEDVVPPAEWPVRRVAAGARVEVLTAMQGG